MVISSSSLAFVDMQLIGDVEHRVVVEIGGKVLNPKKTYTVATSDYLAGGADHMEALTKYVKYWNSDLLIRDLYLEEVQLEDTIQAAVDGRMKLL